MVKNKDDLTQRIRNFQKKNDLDRRCADCLEVGPTYVNITHLTFICTICSGIHREFTHKVKGISMTKWTEDEVINIEKNGGNEKARKHFMATWSSSKFPEPQPGQIQQIKELIKLKYVDQEWVDNSPPIPIETEIQTIKHTKTSPIVETESETEPESPPPSPPPSVKNKQKTYKTKNDSHSKHHHKKYNKDDFSSSSKNKVDNFFDQDLKQDTFNPIFPEQSVFNLNPLNFNMDNNSQFFDPNMMNGNIFNTSQNDALNRIQQFPTQSNEFTIKNDAYSTNNVYTPTNQFNTQLNGYPMQSNEFPIQPNQFSTQANQFPTQNNQFPMQTNQFLTNQFSAQNNQFSAQNNQFPTQTGQFPTQTGQFPTQTNEYAMQANGYASQLNAYLPNYNTFDGNNFTGQTAILNDEIYNNNASNSVNNGIMHQTTFPYNNNNNNNNNILYNTQPIQTQKNSNSHIKALFQPHIEKRVQQIQKDKQEQAQQLILKQQYIHQQYLQQQLQQQKNNQLQQSQQLILTKQTQLDQNKEKNKLKINNPFSEEAQKQEQLKQAIFSQYLTSLAPPEQHNFPVNYPQYNTPMYNQPINYGFPY